DLVLTIPPGPMPLLTLEHDGAGLTSAALNAEIASSTIAGTTAAGPMSLRTGQAKLRGAWTPAAGAQVHLDIVEAAGEWPQKGWLIDGIAANLDLAPDGSGDFDLSGGTMRQRAARPWVVPLHLGASGHVREGTIDISGHVSDETGRFDLAFAGRHDL